MLLGGGAGLPANSTGGRGGRGNSLDSSHPHPTHFFCPVPANRPKEMNKLHPSRIFSPSVNYHKQMLDRLAIWFGLTFWVPPRSVSAFTAWLLALGIQPTMGTTATKHNGGFTWVNFLVNTAGIDAAISFARIFIHWCPFFFSWIWTRGTVAECEQHRMHPWGRIITSCDCYPTLALPRCLKLASFSTEERSLDRWHLLGHLDRDHRHCNKYD